MNNFNLQAYIKSGQIHGENKLLTEAQATGFGTGEGRSKTISKGKESSPKTKPSSKDEKGKKSKYFMKDGIPHKADGTPLKKVKEDERTDAEKGKKQSMKANSDAINPGNTKDDQSKKDDYDYDSRPSHMKEAKKDEAEKINKADALSKMKVSELKAKIKETILAELSLSEADEEVEVDIDVEDEVEVEAGADDIKIERPGVKTTIDVGLSPEEEIVQDSLKAAMDAANELGSQKLADQIGNTITFFTRQFVVGDNTD